MHVKKVNKSRKLYRSKNTTTHHRSNNPGGDYRWERNKKRAFDEEVAQHEHQQRDIVCCGGFSFYPGLYIDEQGLLQQVNPQVTAEDLPVTCRCCTHTFIGVPVLWRGA